MPRPTADVRNIAKAHRERERQEKKAEKLAKRRDAREQRPEPETERAWQAPQETERGR